MTAMHIGSKITKKSQKSLTKQLAYLMKKGRKHLQSGKTIRHAMSALIAAAEVKNVTVSNCHFEMSGASLKATKTEKSKS